MYRWHTKRAAARATALTVAFSIAAAAPAAAEHSACSGASPTELAAPNVVRLGLTATQFSHDLISPSTGLSAQGYRPLRITGYSEGGPTRFMTKWIKAAGPELLPALNLTADGLQSSYLARRALYRPVDISAYTTPAGPRFAITWQRNAGGPDWRLRSARTRAQMDELVDDYERQGFVPRRVEAYHDGGGLRFASIWVKASCTWKMHNRMSRATYEERVDDYADRGWKILHLDSYRDDGRTRYAAIWTRNAAATPEVRSDRPWYGFLRRYSASRCAGREIDNFYVTTFDGRLRYGGIFRPSAAPAPTLSSPFASRLGQEVECAPGRAGAAVIDVTGNVELAVNGTTSYGTSSTIKSAILYALLRRIDQNPNDAITLDLRRNVGAQYGDNQADRLTASRTYSLRQLATFMIDDSNNWATNRLIDFVTMARVNSELDRLGRSDIRLRRYMTGTGSPSVDDNGGATGDYDAGIDNTARPLGFARFLRRMHEGSDLTGASRSFFWNTLALNGTAHRGILNPGGVAPAIAQLAEKAGSNTWNGAPEHKPELSRHLQRSAAGRVVLTDGRVLVYAAFIDEGDRPSGQKLDDARAALQTSLDCIVLEAVREGIRKAMTGVGGSTSTRVASCRGE